ncbi:MAG TPA: CRISPR-associated protein Cas4 [Aggregatilineales bacterium]|nr:CRISPR-associated protein Cas4 [Anaerolineales bacterium]HRE48628.1 CRISPR-associated protein Cas4 [Aggregatilineales bacterium]
MAETDQEARLFRVTDLKQYLYCPRTHYYHTCLPEVRPTTAKMAMGKEAHEDEPKRAVRRELEAMDSEGGVRHFNVTLIAPKLGLSGKIDEVIEVATPTRTLIPVDYKLSRTAGTHFKAQVAAYGMMLEEIFGLPVTKGYLYLITVRQAESVAITGGLRNSVKKALETMRWIADGEHMPPPTDQVNKCISCEFRRFCNDVV